MSKKSVLERNAKREKLALQLEKKRAELKKMIKDSSCSFKEKLGYIQKLDNLPVDSSKIRQRNRCSLTGRPRGYNRILGISRIMLREMIHFIPGCKKASW